MTKGSRRAPSKERRVKDESKSQTLGYPVLEDMIETEDSKLSSFDRSKEALKELSKQSKNPDVKAHARQALLAYERFQHFFEQMFNLREKMIREAQDAEQSQTKVADVKKFKKPR